MEARERFGGHQSLHALQARLPVVARVGRTTLLTGETGVGKDVLARDLHALSPRANRPFVVVQCGALPDNLVEAELFGYRKGAFTGAGESRPGLVKAAAGGTLFLDEVNSLSLTAQSRLLRFLESGEYRPVGADRSEHSDAWVLAASNQDLAQLAREGAFRADLYFRLAAVCLHLPALRERGQDVLRLADHFLAQVAPTRRFTDAARVAMLTWPWPGNVRELRHRVESAALFAEQRDIDIGDLGLSLGEVTRSTGASSLIDALWALIEADGLSLPAAVERCEQLLISEGLRRTANNRTRTAARLGIHLRTLYKKLPCPVGQAHAVPAMANHPRPRGLMGASPKIID